VRVLFASTSGAGHVGPLLPLADAFVRRGDDVTFVVPPAAEPLVHGRGIGVIEGGAPPEEVEGPLWRRFAEAARPEARRIAEREYFATLCTEAMLPVVSSVVERWRPELVIREPCEYASAVCALRRGVPVSTVGISFSAAERSVLDFVADILDRHRRGTSDALGQAPYLTRFPPSLDPSPFRRTFRYREPVVDGLHADAPVPWAERAGPHLYVTFGTRASALPNAGQVFQSVLEAVRGLDASVLLTVGNSFDPSSLGAVPPHVQVATWVPQESVLSRCDAVVCHGGSGTTFGALAHGVPVGFVPLFADQPANARAVSSAGAGIVMSGLPEGSSVPEIGRAHSPAMRRMIDALLGDPTYRDAARRVSEELAAQPDVTETADLLARWAAGAPLAECGGD
jgi:UDP:flavonoid glycosyltransferase YjiC (YdhE family)